MNLFFFSFAISARMYSKSGSFFSMIRPFIMSCLVFSCQAEAILCSLWPDPSGAVEFALQRVSISSKSSFVFGIGKFLISCVFLVVKESAPKTLAAPLSILPTVFSLEETCLSTSSKAFNSSLVVLFASILVNTTVHETFLTSQKATI